MQNKKKFIYYVYLLMGLIDINFSKKLGLEMMLFTIILISIKIYSAYLESLLTLIITSILSIFLLFNNSNISYKDSIQKNKEIEIKKTILQNSINNIDLQISKYWFSGDVLLKLQHEKTNNMDELNKLGKNINNLTNPLILILTMSTIYLCLIILVKKLQLSDNDNKDKDCKSITTLTKETSREQLILDAKKLRLNEFIDKYGYKKSQYYNLKNKQLKTA